MNYLPINLRLEGGRCLVVGGGNVALQKVRVLSAAGARTVVVAPKIDPQITSEPGVTPLARGFEPADLDGMLLAIAATNDARLNHRIHDLATERGILVNVVDDPAYCQFIFPSILRRGELAISVSTAGAGPALARLLRTDLERRYDRDFGRTLELLRELRGRTRRELVCPGARRAANECLSYMAFRASHGRPAGFAQRMEGLVQELGEAAARERRPAPLTASALEDRSAIPRDAATGCNTLVGAGPGRPDLITLAGLNALRRAEVVVYDRLVNTDLLAHAPRAEHLYMGKEPGRGHHVQQDRINDYIVDQALSGRRVVRLKGGDPLLFGRGGEEVQAAREKGVPVRIIPGVTSGLAAAASAGIPITHRDLASSVAFVTGRGSHGRGLDWAALARAVDTIVIYMAVQRNQAIAQELIEAGLPTNRSPRSTTPRSPTSKSPSAHWPTWRSAWVWRASSRPRSSSSGKSSGCASNCRLWRNTRARRPAPEGRNLPSAWRPSLHRMGRPESPRRV